jgi:peptidoglycan/xylan/chitin deacetylase (PgdA/CDA1 family)
MPLKHRLLEAFYQPLKLSNKLLKTVGAIRKGRLRVLLYHDIAPVDEAKFSAQLRWLSHSWQFVTPRKFAAMISGELPVLEDSLLLTFDDGFASNLRIADTVLDPMGIKALFFIVSEFANLSDSVECRDFIAKNIYPNIPLESIPSHWQNMQWSHLSYLLESGHSIGAHTANHARLSKLSGVELAPEIILSADILEKKLGSKIEHFAYTFGDLSSFSPEALAVARSRFKFIHTGLRGFNSSNVMPWAIRRDAITARDSFSLMGALLEGGADRFYAPNLAIYESWGA